MSAYTKHEVLLSAENIGMQYGDKVVLRDVNFAIRDIHREGLHQGQVVSLVGRSGIGKTQLFRILSGLLQPVTGTVRIDEDQHIVKPGEVGIVPQNYMLFNHRTIYQNLKIGVDSAGGGLNDAAKRKLIDEYAKAFELQEHLKKYPAQLSGGQRQRVSIIQQVLTGNRFILLDEPFSGLDVLMIDRVTALLQKISTLNEHNTLIIVSHDIENAAAISDMVWILGTEEGKPGATIVKEYDLCAMGLAWEPHIRENMAFVELLADIRRRL
ncbi:ATP-binding cassette domain-containing protein [Chitinophaga horti]|uniref:ATP-binding cassette domain-containing protein n=1 Tax=Chitinophaga horti TaxID=2920382 RepID=A0ABY6IY37_9BACT|nr:ATP-binding cassette domain-containing protein [Chitinophaga horti]UYQ92295.1 ATP-binding cassette domain-containing protein [Chitinophaga horti]